MDDLRRLGKRLSRQMHATCEAHGLLAPGDRVMVAVSGGKDSWTLLDLLLQAQRALPFRFELVAVHLDQGQPGYDGAPLLAQLESMGAPYEVLREDTYSVVTAHLAPGSTYCSLCSRLRRGVLYSAAERLGCNKLALGHHRDDALETFLLNLVYGGRMQAMPARYTTDDGRFEVIRPLVECAEEEIARYAAARGFAILPCNLCGSQEGLKREAMSALLTQLERDNPHVRSSMLNALRNVRPTHLLDRDVARAWSERDPSIRPAAEPPARVEHHRAEPVVRSDGRVRLVVRGED
jgi:tRNA 2-thiocytidine biosynthesis protein TtcA